MTHKSIIESTRKLIIILGGRFYLLHQSGRVYGSAGIPDSYIILEKYAVKFWFEAKMPNDKLRPAQLEFLDAERICGGSVVVGGVGDVLKYLNQHGVNIH